MIALDGKPLAALNDNKIIWIINALYSVYLQSIIRAVRQTYPSVPLTNENIYWEFMYEVPQLLKKLEAVSDEPLLDEKKCKTFLGNRLRYFTYTLCHHWMKRSHSVLNDASSYDDELAPNKREVAVEDNYELQDVAFDLSVLSPEEQRICELVLFQDQSIKAVMAVTHLSRYKIKRILEAVKAKLAAQVKAQTT